jgi:3-polyprenyl-4-hydroxybenzoate decarboxylase
LNLDNLVRVCLQVAALRIGVKPRFYIDPRTIQDIVNDHAAIAGLGLDVKRPSQVAQRWVRCLTSDYELVGVAGFGSFERKLLRC